MPGIFGAVYNKHAKANFFSFVDNVIESIDGNQNLKIDRFIGEDEGVSLGRSSLGVFNDVSQPIRDHNERYKIIFHGELYNNATSVSDPEYILDFYTKKGDKVVSELNGIFHFAIYDKHYKQVKLCSDKFGLQPLYYAVLPEGVIFAAEVKYILQYKTVSREPDYNSFADFFHYGQILGHKTLFKSIQLLAPASILTFDLADKKQSLTKYWHLENLFCKDGQTNPNDIKVSVEEAISQLVKAVKARASQPEILGLSLSGGLDTRGILAGLGKDAQGMQTYTLGLTGCTDQKLAQKMAQVAQTNHEFIALNGHYLDDYQKMAQNMIWLSDGMYPPHESTEMLAFEYFKRADFKILLRGHGGEIAKAALAYPVMVTPEINSYTNKRQILKYIFKKTNLVTRDIDVQNLFAPTFNSIIKDAAEKSLEYSCGEVAEILSPADVCIYYYINEVIRRQVLASLDIFRQVIEIRMPYIDEEYLSLLLHLPVAQRNKGEFHYEFIKKLMPLLIKIPDSNTGAPMDANPIRLFATDKFQSLMKRFSVLGFRHYTEFHKWYRTGFREATENILFSKLAGEREIFQMSQLKMVFEQHMTGKKNYAHLLGTAVGLELWFKNFVDTSI